MFLSHSDPHSIVPGFYSLVHSQFVGVQTFEDFPVLKTPFLIIFKKTISLLFSCFLAKNLFIPIHS